VKLVDAPGVGPETAPAETAGRGYIDRPLRGAPVLIAIQHRTMLYCSNNLVRDLP